MFLSPLLLFSVFCWGWWNYISLSFQNVGHNLLCLAINNFALQFTLNRQHLRSNQTFFCALITQLSGVGSTTSRVYSCNTANSNTPLWRSIRMWTLQNLWHTHKGEARQNKWICTSKGCGACHNMNTNT